MKNLILFLVTFLVWGIQGAFAQTRYGKTFYVDSDTTINIYDFISNKSGSGEFDIFNRILNSRNGKYKVTVSIPNNIEGLRLIENCKKIDNNSFVLMGVGIFDFSYSREGERFRVLGHLNYSCKLLLDGQPTSDTIFIKSDEDLKKEIGVPTGIYKNCWWLFDQLIEENVLPYTANKVPLKDLVGNNKERLIILQTNDGSYNSDENGEPLGYSRDSVIIIDQRVPTAISSVSKEEIRITRTTCGFIIQGAKSGQHLCLYSLSGQLVWSDRIKGTSQEVMLPGISGGTYILRVENVSLKVIF